MDSKSVLRVKAKNIRRNLNITEISAEIVSKIRELKLYKSAKNVMIYYPMPTEINILGLLKDTKNFFLPKVDGRELLVCSYTNDLQKSELNIFEPATEPIDPNILDLAFVPALMVDKEGYRLGYGGGFYDRFLAKYPDIKTIVPIPQALVTNSINPDIWDIKMKYIITQSQ